MARGAEGKLRRRNEKKKARQDEAESMLNHNTSDFMAPVEEDDSDDEPADTGADVPPPKKKKSTTTAAAAPVPPKKKQGIKTLPLILLAIMLGTTLLPALIYAGDWLGSMSQKHNFIGSLGYKLGLGPSPKKRVLSFYEKHDPTKLNDVDSILSKHYGSYPTLIKKLERKYGDYGYFLGWEQDEAPMTVALEHVAATKEYLGVQFNRYAPQFLKTAVRNVRYNLGFLYKKGRKVWKKHVWPILEPVFGVPKGTAAQKRKDREEARKRKPKPSQTRRKNTEFRDDFEEEQEHEK